MSYDRIVGIDPGSKNVGLTIMAADGTIEDATTIHRPDDHDRAQWVFYAVESVLAITDTLEGAVRYAIEGTTDYPKSHIKGKRINPAAVMVDLIDTAACMGGMVAVFPGARIIPPNGNDRARLTGIPECLIGSRKDLPFTPSQAPRNIRDHEISAWAIARKAMD